MKTRVRIIKNRIWQINNCPNQINSKSVEVDDLNENTNK